MYDLEKPKTTFQQYQQIVQRFYINSQIYKKFKDKTVVLDIEYVATVLGTTKNSIDTHNRDKLIQISKDQYKSMQSQIQDKMKQNTLNSITPASVDGNCLFNIHFKPPNNYKPSLITMDNYKKLEMTHIENAKDYYIQIEKWTSKLFNNEIIIKDKQIIFQQNVEDSKTDSLDDASMYNMALVNFYQSDEEKVIEAAARLPRDQIYKKLLQGDIDKADYFSDFKKSQHRHIVIEKIGDKLKSQVKLNDIALKILRRSVYFQLEDDNAIFQYACADADPKGFVNIKPGKGNKTGRALQHEGLSLIGLVQVNSHQTEKTFSKYMTQQDNMIRLLNDNGNTVEDRIGTLYSVVLLLQEMDKYAARQHELIVLEKQKDILYQQEITKQKLAEEQTKQMQEQTKQITQLLEEFKLGIYTMEEYKKEKNKIMQNK